MGDVYLEAFRAVFQPQVFIYLLIGTTVGLIIGILPGLGGTVGMSILLPFVFGLEPTAGIALLIGMAAVVHTSDTFPSVLFGVPGSAGSQATIMDGFPLAKQGRAGEALGAAFTASLLGGLIGAFVLGSVIFIARPLILAFGSPELFMLSLLGLATVALVSGGGVAKGAAAGLFGMLLGTIGGAPAVAEYRFTFDMLYLFSGIPLAVLALGLFAIPEMVDLLVKGTTIAASTELSGGKLRGFRATIVNWRIVAMSSTVGVIMGMIPGVGGSVVDWITYGATSSVVRDNSQFGKGDIRGVIGPESANNAKEGGALIPTLLFGIPGSGTGAILLGGLLLMGIQAGPNMAGRNLDVTLSIVWTLAIANAVGALACFAVSPWMARISSVPVKRLVPVLLVVMIAAAYQSSRSWGDVFLLGVIGLLGWALKYAGWPRPPILIGFVLSLASERYLHLSRSRYGWEWLQRPGVIVIAVVICLLLVYSGIRSFKEGRSRASS